MGTECCVLSSTRSQYQGIANTLVQLIPRLHLGCNRAIATDSVGRATLQKTDQEVSIIDKALEANRN
jgi:hypothetical protein